MPFIQAIKAVGILRLRIDFGFIHVGAYVAPAMLSTALAMLPDARLSSGGFHRSIA